ncbi:MAG: GlxA family transcriptional regulator [Pseudomonadota bacterium]
MQKKTKSAHQVVKIDVLLFEHFSNHCLANTIEPIRAANALADETLYQWRYVSLDGGEVISSSGLPVATEKLDVPGEKVDLLFAMPSYGFRELATPALCRALRQAEQRTKTMVGFDTGAWLFAAAGLLDGKKATIHSAILDEFSEQFLSVSVRSDRLVIDGNYITCGGAMAAFDLALHLIGIQYGAMLKHDVEAFFLYQNEPPDLIDHKKNMRSTLVRRALRTMDDNLETSLTIQQIAQQLDTNVKELQRRFSQSLGMTPAQVLRHKKLNHAKTLLLSTQMPIAEITVRCGYENASAMTRAFKKKFGSSPLSYRLQSND